MTIDGNVLKQHQHIRSYQEKQQQQQQQKQQQQHQQTATTTTATKHSTPIVLTLIGWESRGVPRGLERKPHKPYGLFLYKLLKPRNSTKTAQT